jgi:hypothetical protein
MITETGVLTVLVKQFERPVTRATVLWDLLNEKPEQKEVKHLFWVLSDVARDLGVSETKMKPLTLTSTTTAGDVIDYLLRL